LSAKTWVPLTECYDDAGRYFRGVVPWERIATGIRQQMNDAEKGIFVVDKVKAHNDRLDRQKDAKFEDEVRDSMRYSRKAIAQEADGNTPRWTGKEVAEGYLMARDGRSKRAPVGRKIFAPSGT
jgi:hypothetical protein